MLTQVAEGVFVHQSSFMQSNTTVVRGPSGVLLIDPGITADEIACVANDVRELGQDVVAGFSTHPHWDHLLWHAEFGAAPRYGTARGATTARERLSAPGAMERVASMLPPDIAADVPMELLGAIDGLPSRAAEIPWDGPTVRILEHEAHAPGHAALVIDEFGVLVAGDMLSDVLIPILENSAEDPIEDYLRALQLIGGQSSEISVVIPGHGSVGGSDELQARIDRDRAYVLALRDGADSSDPRIGPSAAPGWEWVADLHAGQAERLGQRS